MSGRVHVTRAGSHEGLPRWLRDLVAPAVLEMEKGPDWVRGEAAETVDRAVVEGSRIWAERRGGWLTKDKMRLGLPLLPLAPKPCLGTCSPSQGTQEPAVVCAHHIPTWYMVWKRAAYSARVRGRAEKGG